ncbi:MAG: hypothetical protein AUJ92_21340 [Armatimonadetes bacterium CG2_30_59_28]|nr:chromate transporter [Armatimonadota bacterium]OIO89474.1 MAG: hypothetical protein AUJ92_21340 [Armatimonadetes bacterium CG2_30_59_28]PIU66108.1 MAG: hypothetical protein COS85_06095 [Armatimonadetes bacterium CG07_land_8_20_14_0_80_59_28]PIX41906.1 MAG: hypothetical protein COZ56_10675 [Armatimonadetes bacterium CG_4_8_14_3_um_filter_58_9]PIY43010.1 MAG: hypothetical protein COZ05_12500 [Armatimonadetes bacterium CG_4_10_14_3_um_filter_59_10]PJB61504.1 MAG: hypothetical protein CO095_203
MQAIPAREPSVTNTDLANVFLRIGSTGFGGMAALLAMVHEQVVERRKWISDEEFAEATAIGQVLPGPIVVDAVTHIGYRLRRWTGAVVSASALILPAFLLMLALTPLYLHFGDVPRMQGVFLGIGAVVPALIAAAGWRIGRSTCTSARSIVIMVAAFVLLAFYRVDPILIVLASGLAGLVLRRGAAEESGP